jgi:hypothetical protein
MTLLAHDEDRALVDGAVPAELTVAFGDVAAPVGAEPLVRFASQAAAPGELLVAPGGDGLWRRAPWPAADALFAAPAPPDGAAVLVVHPDEPRRRDMAAKLAAHDLRPTVSDRPRVAELLSAAVVIFLDDGGFPALAPSACAAARTVVLQHPAPLFGLQDGVDCFVADDDRAVLLAQAAARAPDAFAAIGAMARIAASVHRASEVYERLGIDLSLGLGRDPRRPGTRA